jgi:hypothetical protein
MILRRLLSVTLVLAALSCATGRPATLGSWQSESGHGYVVVEAERLVWFDPDQNDLSVGTVLSRNGELVTRHRGKIERVSLAQAGDNLVVTIEGKPQTYHRAGRLPEAMSLSPLTLGTPAELPQATVDSVRDELLKRNNDDQQLLKSKAAPEKIRELQQANDAWLREVVSRNGWIDLHRFGPKASGAAIVMAKHSADTRLLLAAMPVIEHDLAADPGFGQTFAIAYDQLRLSLGQKQRYGSQICSESGQRPFLCAVETPSHLDERRATIGLTPMAEYLELVSKMLFKNQPVRVPADADVQ